MKKILSVFAAFLIIAASLPASVFAEVLEKTDGIYTYYVDNGWAAITDVDSKKAEGVIIVPDEINHYPVQSIATYAFANCNKITEVILSDGIEYLDSYAFENCRKLKKVTLGENLRYFNHGVFENCVLLETIVLNQKIYIEYDNFSNGCKKLKEFVLNGQNANHSVKDGILYNKDFTEIICIPNAISGDIVIPVGVTDISYGFEYTQITSIAIPNTVKTIGNSTFAGCDKLVTVELGDSITYIGEGAFNGCDSLKNIDLSGTAITEIQSGLFQECNSLTAVKLPDTVTYIGDYAFSYCDFLETVEFGDEISSLGEGFFYDCDSLENIDLSETEVTEIPMSAFQDCEMLTSVKLPDSVTYIGNSAFAYCSSLESVDLGDGLQEIEWEVFYNCDSLETIELPESLTAMDSQIFTNCDALESITVPSSVVSFGEDMFSSCPNLKTAVINAEIDALPLCTFSNCDKLESVTLSDTITKIDNEAFYYCDDLKNISFPKNLTEIGEAAFANCYAIKTLNLPESLTTIGNYAFAYNDNIFAVALGKNITSVGESAFTNYFEHLFYSGTEDEWNNSVLSSALSIDDNTIKHFETSYSLSEPVLVEPDCTYNGYYKYHCSVCETDIEKGNIQSTGHNRAELVESVNATCSSEGYDIFKCSECGEQYYYHYGYSEHTSDGRVLGKVDPTCNEDGYTIYHCSVCDQDYNDNWVYSNGHTFDDSVEPIVVDPTCTEEGYTIYHCPVCDEDFKSMPTEPLGHQPAEDAVPELFDSTCISRSGESYTCTVCNEEYNVYIGGYGTHNWEDEVCTICNVKAEDCCESEHIYSNNFYGEWFIQREGAYGLEITFSELSSMEPGCDFVRIYDGQWAPIGEYTGYSLAGETVRVIGDTAIITFSTDESVNDYFGFAVQKVEVIPPETNGSCGDGLDWYYEESEKALYIEGDGIIDQNNYNLPWSNFDINYVYFKGEIINPFPALQLDSQIYTVYCPYNSPAASVATDYGLSIRYFGDIDGMEGINATDITFIRKYLLEDESYDFSGCNVAMADVNYDGDISIKDLVRIKKVTSDYLYDNGDNSGSIDDNTEVALPDGAFTVETVTSNGCYNFYTLDFQNMCLNIDIGDPLSRMTDEEIGGLEERDIITYNGEQYYLATGDGADIDITYYDGLHLCLETINSDFCYSLELRCNDENNLIVEEVNAMPELESYQGINVGLIFTR